MIRFEREIETAGEALSLVSKELNELLRAALREDELLRILLGVQEMLRNAYEHGNLGIGAEDKERLLEGGDFERELSKRALQARQQGRTIKIALTCSDDEFTCVVRDDGAGIGDPGAAAGPSCPVSLRGRGLGIIRSSFDEVSWNDVGNEISVRKRIAPKA
ncbi:MAG: ATP-binding protein [Deltaproteobacteria bacterium]|nr:ATP-binding protein [Deltaproteobacteria bacterium]